MDTSAIQLAIPVFFLLIGVEVVVARCSNATCTAGATR
jgi:hypothetical protein